MATKLLLIRHGETDWNLKKRYCGHNDISLNATGKDQARRLRQRLEKEKIHKVYSSDRKRAVETARIVFGALEIETIPQLREIHFGSFEGLTHNQIIKRHRRVYEKWLKDPFNNHIPGGEPLPDFRERIASAFNQIISHNRNKIVAVVCHGGSISILISHILKTNTFWEFMPHSTGLTVIEYANAKPMIRLLNDTSHLNG